MDLCNQVCLSDWSIHPSVACSYNLNVGHQTQTFQLGNACVTVSMSAFLACHQCYCAGSSLAWGLSDSVFLDYHND